MMVDAQFEDPNTGIDALWMPGGQPPGVMVRVRRRVPEGIVPVGGNPFDLDAMLIDVRLCEVAEPAERDAVFLLDEDGAITDRLIVTGMAGIDTRRLVRTCEVAAVLDDEDGAP